MGLGRHHPSRGVIGLKGLKFCQNPPSRFFLKCSCTTALYCAKYVVQRRSNVFLTECNAHGSLLSPKHPIAIAFYIGARIPIVVKESLVVVLDRR